MVTSAAFLTAVTLKSSLLLVMITLSARTMSRASAATRHLLWTGGIVALLILPLLELGLPRRLPVLALDLLPSAGAAFTDPAPTAGHASSTEGASSAAGTPGGVHVVATVGLLLVVVWAGGACALTLRLVSGWRTARRIVGRAVGVEWTDSFDGEGARSPLSRVGSKARVVRSPDALLPFTTGILRPVVVLPPEADRWPLERRLAVLVHEVAHVSRRDVAVRLLAQIACALHWPNPLAWHAMRQLGREAERACDDQVLAAGVHPSRYATELLTVMRGVSPMGGSVAVPPVAVAMGLDLEQRVGALLRTNVSRRGPSRWGAAALFTAVSVSALPLAAVQIQELPTRRTSLVATSDSVRVSLLVETLARDPSSQARALAAWGLGQLGDSRALEGLATAVSDEDATVRVTVVWALQELDEPRALPSFRLALTDASVEVRRMAARGLADLDFERPPPELVAATADPDELVRKLATFALGAGR